MIFAQVSIMSNQVSTKERLLSIVTDMELISKEMIDNIILPKGQRVLNVDIVQLVELLIWKNNELNEYLKLAEEQAEIDKKIKEVKAEVDKYDQYIVQLQTKLKSAEQILSTAIYQAKQKLQSISRANKRPVSSEELIKFAHRISASNAVCAPLSWQQGDPRRPYPTDIEMRLGLLGRLSDLPINGNMLQQQQQQQHLSEIQQRPSSSREINQPHSNQFAWHPSGEIHMLVGNNQTSVPVESQNHKQESEDVEVMSSDSSSSSSSDSQ